MDRRLKEFVLEQRRIKMIDQKYRKFWKRFGAGFLDGLLLMPVSLFMHWIWTYHQSIPNVILAPLYIATSTIYYAYNIYFLGKYGQTLGKMALDTGWSLPRTAYGTGMT
jgi:uncharacterized RDD family membrane protein YckC